MTAPLRVALLGSTGSIGRQVVEVAERHPNRVRIVSLAANRRAPEVAAQAKRLRVGRVAIADPTAVPAGLGLPPATRLATGNAAVLDLATDPEADLVVNALVGAAGLRATEATLRSGKRLALANKESLVVGGDLLVPLARPGQLIPVDSEHSAIFQCLLGEPADAIARLWVTASGGPFRGWDRAALRQVSVDQALAHPRWSMGPKITIDSATLMNKGLEVIEAHHLFGMPYDRIFVVVHPQSTVHSMVEFVDGSVKAHIGVTDMRVPIQYALSFPERWDAPLPGLDLSALGPLEFEPPDLDTFRCLGLALEAGRAGGTMPAAMSAADEVAVAAFLAGRARFVDIEAIVATVMDEHHLEAVESLVQLESVDARARERADELVHAL